MHPVTWVCLKVKDRKSTEMVDLRRQPTGVRAKSETFESQPCQLLYASLPCINSLGPVPCSDGKAGYCLGTNHYTSTYTKTIRKKIIYIISSCNFSNMKTTARNNSHSHFLRPQRGKSTTSCHLHPNGWVGFTTTSEHMFPAQFAGLQLLV